MSTDDLAYMSATELAARIKEKSLSPIEVTTALLERAERSQASLNAFITICADEALAAARDARLESLGATSVSVVGLGSSFRSAMPHRLEAMK